MPARTAMAVSVRPRCVARAYVTKVAKRAKKAEAGRSHGLNSVQPRVMAGRSPSMRPPTRRRCRARPSDCETLHCGPEMPKAKPTRRAHDPGRRTAQMIVSY